MCTARWSPMSNKGANIRDIVQFEIESKFPFPTISVLIATFLAVGMYSALTHSLVGAFDPLGPSPDFIQYLNEVIRLKSLSVFVTSIANSIFPLMVMVPLIVGFTFAQNFDTGLIQTLLSYPIKRNHLFFLKYLNIVFLVGISVTVGSLASVVLFVPVVSGLDQVPLVLAAIWSHIMLSVALAFFLAVITKNLAATAFGSTATLFGLFFLISWMPTPALIKLTLFLPGAIGGYFGTGGQWIWFSAEIIYQDIIVGLILCCLLTTLLLAASYAIFSRTGV